VQLSKTDQQRKATLTSALRSKAEELEAAVDSFNTAVSREFEKVQIAVAAYNAAMGEACEFAEAIASDLQNIIDARSEKWQESEASAAASALCEQWERIVGESEAIEVEEPDPLGMPDVSLADELDGLDE
jgi:hypothetical protein